MVLRIEKSTAKALETKAIRTIKYAGGFFPFVQLNNRAKIFGRNTLKCNCGFQGNLFPGGFLTLNNW